MKASHHLLALLLLLGPAHRLAAQSDSTRLDALEQRTDALDRRITESILRMRASEQNTFYLYKYLSVTDTSLQRQPVTFSGYVDAYYAAYTEDTPGPFVSFPTIAPRDRDFGLNMVYFGAKLDLEKARATVGLQFGDVPASAWSTDAPFVQEANAGLRILPRLWLDAGYFRTHIGAESIQPRENICQSLANTTYFEPYFLSGAKLTWDITERLALQLNAFNGFNTFVENNTNKAAGLSAVYKVGEGSVLSLNTLLSDERRGLGPAKARLYNDLYFIHHSKRIDWCAEANLGVQGRSRLDDSTRTAVMYSFILAAKYKLGKWAPYLRGELFEDTHEILTGPLENANHDLVGLNLWGLTAGIEFRPVECGFIRLEGRHIQTTPDETIFRWRGQARHQRQELIAALGVWF